MPRILIIDDDEQLIGLLREYFARFELSVEGATRPSEGLARLKAADIDLVVLDVMLPEMDGFEVCRRIRSEGDLPIIMLTARGDTMDRVVGLELGADDYLPKPFEPRELVARIQRILKRTARPTAPGDVLAFGPLQIDTSMQTVTLEGRRVDLTSAEYRLLVLLAGEPGHTFSRDEILNRLKGVDADLYSRAVDILVSRLRGKLRPADVIRTVRGAGYCFVGRPA